MDGAPLEIGAKLELMESGGAGWKYAASDWTERGGLSLEAWPTLEVGAHAWRGMLLGVEKPLEVSLPLSMGLVVVSGVGALDAIVPRVDALIGVISR